LPVGTTEQDTEAIRHELLALHDVREQLATIARAAENRANLVDEYNSANISGAASSAQVQVFAQYEYMPEKIESIIVAGVAGSVTLQIGDRQLALTIPASGLLVVAPVAMLLGRNDPRTLTPGTPGVYFLELMGIADRRFKI
jgi:hypothetical protein